MITTIRADGRTQFEPAEGKSVTNGEVYSKLVIVGLRDNPANWTEINDADIPPPVQDDPLSELEGLL